MSTETAREDVANACQMASGALEVMDHEEFLTSADYERYVKLLQGIERRLRDALRKMGSITSARVYGSDTDPDARD